jgi:hypothetical protein
VVLEHWARSLWLSGLLVLWGFFTRISMAAAHGRNLLLECPKICALCLPCLCLSPHLASPQPAPFLLIARRLSKPVPWAQMGGLSYLDFIRGLQGRVEADWDGVRADLEAIRTALLAR